MSAAFLHSSPGSDAETPPPPYLYLISPPFRPVARPDVCAYGNIPEIFVTWRAE